MPPKGPSEKRSAPRRLFSFDSIKTASEKASSPHINTTLLPNVRQSKNESRVRGDGTDGLTEDRTVESPLAIETHSFNTESRALHAGELHTPSRSMTPDSQLRYSKSRARWENLRQHVLPPSERPETPPIPSQPPSAGSRDVNFSRPSTPKVSRFPRLGFRHVVEHAREVDDSRKFAEEVLRACWSARYPEALKGRGDKDQGTIGSALYLPFMSTTSITTTGTSSANGISSTKKSDFRPAQASQISLTAGLRPTPTLRFLYQIINHHASIVGDTKMFPVLPHENQVLSTILFPFLSPQTVLPLEEEQVLAVQLFDLISRTWPSESEAHNVERCLWCCKAAIAPSTVRAQIIGILWRILAPGDGPNIVSVHAVQTVAQSLFMLLSSLASPSGLENNDIHLVKELITKFQSTSYGELDGISLEEWYHIGAGMENQETLRNAVILDSLFMCLEHSSVKTCFWLLQHMVEDLWPSPGGALVNSPLLATIQSRRLATFCRMLLPLLSNEKLRGPTKINMTQQICRIIGSRAIPEANRLQGKYALDAQSMVTRVLYEMLCLEDMKEIVKWSVSILSRWYCEDGSWKASMEKSLHQVIAGGNWTVSLRLLLILTTTLSPQICKSLFTFALPVLNDQLVQAPPPYPCSQLTKLLQTLSHLYPQLFYKPLFSCAASSKEFTVVNHLCVLKIHAKFLPDYWTRDAEMLSVALMSDAGARKETFKGERTGPPWAKARLGQSVIMLELIAKVQAIRHEREISNSESSFMDIIKFIMIVEARVSILLEARERTVLIPPSQRMLFCMLFREFRLLTRTLRRATWVERAVSWFAEFFADDHLEDEVVHEPKEAIIQIQGLYEAARSGVSQTNKRRTTFLLTPDPETSGLADKSKEWDLAISFAEQNKLIKSLSDGYAAKAMKLFVAVSQMVSDDDYRRLGPVVWRYGLMPEESPNELNMERSPGHRKHSYIATACFLIMQCAEKSPLDLLAVIEVDMQTSDDTTRLEAVRKISTLINWRFQILSQNIIMDRLHRPFKLARPALPFIPTDMGSTLYIQEDSYSKSDDNVPNEIRKRLAEIGWAEDNAPTDEREEWMRTPMSLLPANQLDRLIPASAEHGIISGSPLNASPLSSPRRSPSPSENPSERSLLRRTSSSGGPVHTIKRRAIFVPALSPLFTRLASLIYDPNFAVASTARNTILDLMRNDPGLLTRPVLDLLSGDHKDVSHAAYIFTAFLHVKRSLPPPMSHHVFNNIAGFLKMASRQLDVPDILQDFAFMAPVLSQLITQVSGMSIREIRRAKVDNLLIPSGSLWFASSSPPGYMFPRFQSERQNPFEDPMTRLTAITLIRTSQNLLFLSMLKRNSQDVQLIRKNMTRLVLPSLDAPASATPLELKDFIPRKFGLNFSAPSNTTALSLMLSRSYLLLAAEVFRSMSRHLNDRNELAVLIDGLNRVLLAHGDDIGIVSQAMIALMIASTRFRRLFTSGGAYALFMPALVKVYIEYSSHPGITLAIEYAINRFYALHQEAFLFQSLDAIARVLMLLDVDPEWTGKGVYTLFFSLTKGITQGTPDPAGIHNINRRQEREALLVDTAETRPQAFLSSMRKPEAGGPISIDLPQEYESRRLAMDNFVRLFLTVIAHDTNIIQAEYFLRLLRVITPSLYNASSTARSILQEGIGALCNILSRNSTKSKVSDSQALSGEEKAAFLLANSTLESQLSGDTKLSSDLTSMRIDFLHLVVAFGRGGGLVSLTIARQILDLVKNILKDATGFVKETVAQFLSEFLRSLLLQAELKSVKDVVTLLREVALIMHASISSADFSGVFETICELLAIPTYAKEPAFSQVVVGDICTAGLAVCELAASENYLSTLSCRPAVITLLSQAVLLQDADVIAEIEKRTQSHIFLTAVVLPVAASIKDETQLAVDNLKLEPWYRGSLARAWVRLVSYIMSTCQRSLRAASEASSKQSTSGAIRTQLQMFVAALQVIKVIIVQADTMLSTSLPGIWERLGSFLKSILSEGNAEFLFSSDRSIPTSPIVSSRASSQFDLSTGSGVRLTLSSHDQTYTSPRMIDYALWSFLEFLCAYRTPLRLQLRLFLREKIVGLNEEVRRRQGSHSPFHPSVGGRRVSTSIFVKARGRTSTHATPDSSPRTAAMQLSSLDISPSTFDMRRPGYQVTPSSPTGDSFARPKITHLGPTTPSALRNPPPSPSGNGGGFFRLTSKSPKMRSLALMNATYRRIRCVQTYAGYEPLAQDSVGLELVLMPAWTKKQALTAIDQENKQLAEEFEETSNDEDSVFVELDPSISFSSK